MCFRALHIFCILELCSSQILDKAVFVNGSALIPRVVNGYQASLGDVPYQIGFKRLKDRLRRVYYTFCGGSIIGESKMLSAAHCFKTYKSGCCTESIVLGTKEVARYFAVAGTLLNQQAYDGKDKSSGAQWRRLEKVIFPGTYKFPRDDIAIVMTIKPFIFNSNVAPVSYAKYFQDYRGECLVSGYGRTGRYDQGSEILLLAKLEILPNYYCNRLHRKNMRKFICTSKKVSDIEKGDSGGPLVCKNTGDTNEGRYGTLVGIVSGKRFASYRTQGGSFFTRVSHFSGYIAKSDAKSLRSSVICFIVILLQCFVLDYNFLLLLL